MKQKIHLLDVGCSNREKGCQWEGKCETLSNHLKEECQFELISCANQCGGHFPQCKLENHQLNECVKGPRIDTDQSGHKDQQVKGPVKKEERPNRAVIKAITDLRREFEEFKKNIVQDIAKQVEDNLHKQMDEKLKSQREELEEEISSYQRQADLLYKQDKDDIEQLKKEKHGSVNSSHSAVSGKTSMRK